MAPSKVLLSPQDYTVGLITALDKELAAAKAVLDEKYQKPTGFSKNASDTNSYAWGRIGNHNVVIASLAAGRYGTVSAATTATQMVSSLPHLRFGLMVGIGAGIPWLEEGIDIRLGDIIVSHPTGTSPGVVQYDLTKLKHSGQVERVGSLGSPPEVLLKGIQALKSNHLMEDSRVPEILEEMIKKYSKMKENGFVYQGTDNDHLFETSRFRLDAVTVGDPTNDRGAPSECSSHPYEKERPVRPSDMPVIHYGTIASGNSVVKDGVARDEILKRLEDKCICFEMEAAGLMNNFPCLVIRGICDYADEYKNDRWQNYAAATAAAFAKELLEVMDSEDIERASPMEETIKGLSDKIAEIRVAQNKTNTMMQDQGKHDDLWRLRQWLSAPDPSTNYNNALQQRHQGSGDWFLRSSEYSAWKTERNSLLWLYGMPGCGKTILSSTIIQDLAKAPSTSKRSAVPQEYNSQRREHKRADADGPHAHNITRKQTNDRNEATPMSESQTIPRPKSPSPNSILYFYFDFSDMRKQCLENAIRSLISQLCSKRPDLQSDVGTLYSSCGKGEQQPIITVLCTTFQDMVEKAGEVWIVLDALDECQTREGGPNEGLLGWMDSLIILQKVHVHFLITSRPEQDIQSAFEDLTGKKDAIASIPLQGEPIEKDIRDYVHTMVTQSATLRRWQSRPDIQKEIETTLSEKAGGMFRWASCQLDILAKCYTPKALQNALVSLPRTLGETYTRILTNVPDCNRNDATRILQFLAFSYRPLRIEEAIDAIAVNLEHEPPYFNPEDRMPVPMEILRCCSSLVAFSEDTREISLAHFSVKEFITSEEDKGLFTSSLEKFTAHESIIEVIVAYLSSLTGADVETCHHLEGAYHLANYCASHWLDHARLVKNSPSARKRLLELFLNAEAWHTSSQILNQGDPINELIDHFDNPLRDFEPLYVAALSGLEYLVHDLLQQGARVNAVSGWYRTALRIACETKHSAVARILIESGADLDIVSDFDDGTALVTAIDKGLIEIARLQIKRGANCHKRGRFTDEETGNLNRIYPLHLACWRRSEKVVKDMIDQKVDINLQDEDHGSALRMACKGGNEEVVKLLLERGVDVHLKFRGKSLFHEASMWIFTSVGETFAYYNIGSSAKVSRRDDEGDALYIPTFRGRLRIFQLLLEKGVDVNARDDKGGSPLHEATMRGREDIVQLLLDYGADIHMRDNEGRSPLEIAEQRGKEQVAQLLRTADGVAIPP